jgi:hypothetical protein
MSTNFKRRKKSILTFALPLEFGFVHQTKNNILLATKVDLAI